MNSNTNTVRGTIKIRRRNVNSSKDIDSVSASSNLSNVLLLNNNHILNQHFQKFKATQYELGKLKDYLEKNIKNEVVVNKLVGQGEAVYGLVSEYYCDIINKLEAISEQISSISDCIGFFQELANTNAYQNTRNSNGNNPNTTTINGTNGDRGSISMKLSTKHFYNEKINKLKKLEQDMLLKNKEILLKTSQLETDHKFIDKITKEKDLLIDSISEDLLRKAGETYNQEHQIKAMRIILNTIYKANLITSTEKEITEVFKVKISSNTKLFKDNLKDVKEINLSLAKLTELNLQLEELIHESTDTKDSKQERVFAPLLKTLKLIVFMSLSKSRIQKIDESINKIKNETSIINEKIEEVKQSIKESKYSSDETESKSELDLNFKLKQHMSHLKILHNQLENAILKMIKCLSKAVITPNDLLTMIY